jgi:hypothetical protein
MREELASLLTNTYLSLLTPINCPSISAPVALGIFHRTSEATNDSEFLSLLSKALVSSPNLPPTYLIALSTSYPLAGVPNGAVLVFASKNAEGLVKELGNKIKESMKSIKGGGKGSYSGKITDKWGSKEEKEWESLVRGVVEGKSE